MDEVALNWYKRVIMVMVMVCRPSGRSVGDEGHCWRQLTELCDNNGALRNRPFTHSMQPFHLQLRCTAMQCNC
jgi:hypothetical protein